MGDEAPASPKHPNHGANLETVLEEFGILEEATKFANDQVAKWQSTTQSTTNNRELNTKHLHEKAYYRGYKDFIHGKLDDPYRKHSLYSKEWQRGQNAAYFVNLRMLHNGSLIRNFHRKKAAKKVQTHSGKAT